MTTTAQYKTRGILLTVSFFVVLVLIFMPFFPGKGKKVNGLDYLDNFFNELSKGSANYIQAEREKVAAFDGKEFTVTLDMKTARDAELASKILYKNGAVSRVIGDKVEVIGKSLGSLLSGMLDDAEAMYYNKADLLQAKYNIEGSVVIHNVEGSVLSEDEKKGYKTFYTWYLVLSSMEKNFTKNSQFAEAKLVKGTMSKAVEPAYNYYGIEGKSVKAEMFLLIAALVFYVVYTMWYGFGLLYLFEGMGIRLDH